MPWVPGSLEGHEEHQRDEFFIFFCTLHRQQGVLGDVSLHGWYNFFFLETIIFPFCAKQAFTFQMIFQQLSLNVLDEASSAALVYLFLGVIWSSHRLPDF